jgi:hypothetical protein
MEFKITEAEAREMVRFEEEVGCTRKPKLRLCSY